MVLQAVFRVIPRASESRILPGSAFPLTVRLHALPVEGRANDELIRLLSKTLRLPQKNFQIMQGVRGRLKRVAITGLDAEEFFCRLLSKK